jgi:hypothetical protein
MTDNDGRRQNKKKDKTLFHGWTSGNVQRGVAVHQDGRMSLKTGDTSIHATAASQENPQMVGVGVSGPVRASRIERPSRPLAVSVVLFSRRHRILQCQS